MTVRDLGRSEASSWPLGCVREGGEPSSRTGAVDEAARGGRRTGPDLSAPVSSPCALSVELVAEERDLQRTGTSQSSRPKRMSLTPSFGWGKRLLSRVGRPVGFLLRGADVARRRREVGVLALVASITNADTGVRIPVGDLTVSGEQTLAADESALLVRCSLSPLQRSAIRSGSSADSHDGRGIEWQDFAQPTGVSCARRGFGDHSAD